MVLFTCSSPRSCATNINATGIACGLVSATINLAYLHGTWARFVDRELRVSCYSTTAITASKHATDSTTIDIKRYITFNISILRRVRSILVTMSATKRITNCTTVDSDSRSCNISRITATIDRTSLCITIIDDNDWCTCHVCSVTTTIDITKNNSNMAIDIITNGHSRVAGYLTFHTTICSRS